MEDVKVSGGSVSPYETRDSVGLPRQPHINQQVDALFLKIDALEGVLANLEELTIPVRRLAPMDEEQPRDGDVEPMPALAATIRTANERLQDLVRRAQNLFVDIDL